MPKSKYCNFLDLTYEKSEKQRLSKFSVSDGYEVAIRDWNPETIIPELVH